MARECSIGVWTLWPNTWWISNDRITHLLLPREKKAYKTSSWFSVIIILLFSGVKILNCCLSLSFSVCWGVLTVLWQPLTQGSFLYHAKLTWFSVFSFWDNQLRPKSVSLTFAKKAFWTEQQTSKKKTTLTAVVWKLNPNLTAIWLLFVEIHHKRLHFQRSQ